MLWLVIINKLKLSFPAFELYFGHVITTCLCIATGTSSIVQSGKALQITTVIVPMVTVFFTILLIGLLSLRFLATNL